jgi:hypothetical protein
MNTVKVDLREMLCEDMNRIRLTSNSVIMTIPLLLEVRGWD